MSHLSFRTTNGCVRFPINAITSIIAEGNYSIFHMIDGSVTTVSVQLGDIINRLNRLGDENSPKIFYRVGRSYVVRLDFIHAIDCNKKRLILSDGISFRQELNKMPKEALKELKTYLETEIDKL